MHACQDRGSFMTHRARRVRRRQRLAAPGSWQLRGCRSLHQRASSVSVLNAALACQTGRQEEEQRPGICSHCDGGSCGCGGGKEDGRDGKTA